MQNLTTKSRLLPFKILGLLLFGRYLWMNLLPTGEWKVGLGPLSRHARTTTHRTRGHLNWLQARDYIESVRFEHGQAYIRMRTPPNSSKAEEQAASNSASRLSAFEEIKQLIERTD